MIELLKKKNGSGRAAQFFYPPPWQKDKKGQRHISRVSGLLKMIQLKHHQTILSQWFGLPSFVAAVLSYWFLLVSNTPHWLLISASRDFDASHSHRWISFVESGIQGRFDLNLHGDIGAFLAAWESCSLKLGGEPGRIWQKVKWKYCWHAFPAFDGESTWGLPMCLVVKWPYPIQPAKPTQWRFTNKLHHFILATCNPP